MNIRGQSFQGKDLSGADFRNADIRGANFANANLKGANFRGAKAGLERHWVIGLILFLWLISVTPGLFLLNAIFICSGIFIAPENNIEDVVPCIVALISTLVFFIMTIRKGLPYGAMLTVAIIPVAILIALPSAQFVYRLLSIDVGGIVSFGGVVFGTSAVAGFVFGTIVTSVIIATTIMVGGIAVSAIAVAIVVTSAIYVGSIGDIPVLIAVYVSFPLSAVMISVSAYISWRSLRGEEKDTWLRAFTVAFAATGGTNFRGADLTNADFTDATLKSTDFREAKLTRTLWHNSQKLDRVRPGTSYLNNAQIRKLLVTGSGEGQNFDRQNLRGVNLKRANLDNASFVNTDLSQTNLQGANLFEAKLVQTNLDQANLSNACLTGAYIEDWGITRRTRLDGIKCEYVYLKLPTEGDRDPNRMPPSEQGQFRENDFNIFITSVLDTLDLYHREDINAGVAVTVLKGLTEKHDVQFEMVGLEKRGNNQFVIKLKVFGKTSHFQLQREYYDRYEQTLPLYDPKKLMPDTDVVFEEIIREVKNSPGTRIENLHNEGIVITGGSVSMSGDRTIHTGGGSYNEKIEGDYILGNKGDTIHQSGTFGIGVSKAGVEAEKIAGTIHEAPPKSMAEAAAEIQQLLEQLDKAYPTDTVAGQMDAAKDVVKKIESNTPLADRVLSALRTGGTEVLKRTLHHPAATFVLALLDDWQKTKRRTLIYKDSLK